MRPNDGLSLDASHLSVCKNLPRGKSARDRCVCGDARLDGETGLRQAFLQMVCQRVEAGYRAEIALRKTGKMRTDTLHVGHREPGFLFSAQLTKSRRLHQRRREVFSR